MDTNNWKWFRYDEVFEIKHGFYNKKPALKLISLKNIFEKKLR